MSCWWAFWETAGEQKTCLLSWFYKYSQLPYCMLFYWYTLTPEGRFHCNKTFLPLREKDETRRWVHNTGLLWGRHSYNYSEVSAKQYLVFSVLEKEKTKFETSLYPLLRTKNFSAMMHSSPEMKKKLKSYMGTKNNKILEDPETYVDHINSPINIVPKPKI